MAAYGGSGGGGGGPQDFGSSQSGNKIKVTLVFTCNLFSSPLIQITQSRELVIKVVEEVVVVAVALIVSILLKLK